MLARLRARGAVSSFRGVRAAGSAFRRPLLTAQAAGSRAQVNGSATRASRGGLTLRVISGCIAIPLLLGIAYLGNPIYGPFIALATAYAAFEMRGMLRAGGYVPVDWLLVGLAALLPLDFWLAEFWSAAPDPIVVVTAFVILGLISQLLHPTSERSLIDWALSVGLALYLGALMQFYMPLRAMPENFPGFWVMALLILSWVCDSSAFFVGRAIGRRRLAPSISPKKSVEGAVAGVICPAIVGPLLGAPFGVNPALMAGYGVAIAL